MFCVVSVVKQCEKSRKPLYWLCFLNLRFTVSSFFSSDVIVQIVDARNPLLFRCPDLEVYVKEVRCRIQHTGPRMMDLKKESYICV